MTSSKENFADYPRQLRSRTQEPFSVYELSTDRFAVHRTKTDARSSSGDDVSLQDGEDLIEVVEGKPKGETAPETNGPVYTTGGAQAIPTGLVFLRFGDGTKIAERADDIEGAGYEIARTIEYAANAGWLRHRSGSMAKSLTGISDLEKIRGVENVEPQMLMRRVSR
ncbi:MAG: hypothetical protein ABI857_03635 [Acidobacteriota bacterium]